jgi:hypothetical protein
MVELKPFAVVLFCFAIGVFAYALYFVAFNKDGGFDWKTIMSLSALSGVLGGFALLSRSAGFCGKVDLWDFLVFATGDSSAELCSIELAAAYGLGVTAVVTLFWKVIGKKVTKKKGDTH